jgi:integrase
MSTDLMSLYDQFERSNRRIRSPQTGVLYRIALRQFASAIGKPAPTIDDLTDDNIVSLEKFLHGRSIETINHTTKRLKALWRWCAQRGMIKSWPTMQRIPAPEPYRRAWNLDEIRRLVAGCDAMTGTYGGVAAAIYWRAWHFLQWDTGERTGALLALRWEWYDGQSIDIPGAARKGGKHAYYRLSELSRESLQQMRSPARELVFPAMSRQSFYNHYSRLLSVSGLPNSRKHKPQRMRRSHLTFWHLAGQDAQQRAQHASGDTTIRHYLDESLMPQVDPASILPPISGISPEKPPP